MENKNWLNVVYGLLNNWVLPPRENDDASFIQYYPYASLYSISHPLIYTHVEIKTIKSNDEFYTRYNEMYNFVLIILSKKVKATREI